MYKFYFEAFLIENKTENSFCHLFFSNINNRIMKSSFDINRFNINAWANFPLDENSNIDLRLFSDKANEILEHTVQYRNRAEKTTIRSDYGHTPDKPHFDIIIEKDGRRIDLNVDQDQKFHSFESIINAVFMQVEKFDSLIGPKYWISPMNIHTERIEIINNEWKKAQILTTLSILSRVVSLEIINKTMEDKEIDDNYFRTIVLDCIENIRQEEKKFDGPLDISLIKYYNSINNLPFNIIFEPSADVRSFFKCYNADGSERNVELLGVMNETKTNENFSRRSSSLDM